MEPSINHNLDFLSLYLEISFLVFPIFVFRERFFILTISKVRDRFSHSIEINSRRWQAYAMGTLRKSGNLYHGMKIGVQAILYH